MRTVKEALIETINLCRFYPTPHSEVVEARALEALKRCIEIESETKPPVVHSPVGDSGMNIGQRCNCGGLILNTVCENNSGLMPHTTETQGERHERIDVRGA